MTYYILPNHNNSIFINLKCDSKINELDVYISCSLYNYYYNVKNQLINLCKFENYDISANSFEEIIKIINPYEYIFSKVPGYFFSVSKLTPNTKSFYDFLEIISLLNIYENYKNQESNFLYISPNCTDILNHLKLVRKIYKNDKIVCFNEINVIVDSLILQHNFNFIFFEINYTETENTQTYIINLINILRIILRCQTKNGISIIKIDNIFYKPIIDIIYILSSVFGNILIIKPSSCNIVTFEKYIVCKNFLSDNKQNIINNYYNNLSGIVHKLKNNLNDNQHIVSLIDTNIPCYFSNKLNDINIVLGQQQLESLYQIINILKNKNKEEKIEIIKKNSIQKSINWCEKFQIPFNKFLDKNNIFLYNNVNEINL